MISGEDIDFSELLRSIAHITFKVEYENGEIHEFLTSPKNINGVGINTKVDSYVLSIKNKDSVYVEILEKNTREELYKAVENGEINV